MNIVFRPRDAIIVVWVISCLELSCLLKKKFEWIKHCPYTHNYPMDNLAAFAVASSPSSASGRFEWINNYSSQLHAFSGGKISRVTWDSLERSTHLSRSMMTRLAQSPTCNNFRASTCIIILWGACACHVAFALLNPRAAFNFRLDNKQTAREREKDGAPVWGQIASDSLLASFVMIISRNVKSFGSPSEKKKWWMKCCGRRRP